ncbi:MAG: T9SS type A sorting domain-containing protein [Candidatus Zixiibacteriota bacterium]|nr:MAG: T9SS type A sorting domain-containing protein [candidate division Zixibacteria bacterium]
MAKSIMISLVIMALLPLYSYAQVPGDMTCDGTFNGLDIIYLSWYLGGAYQSSWIDTSSCSWLGGDMNGDSLFHTVADWWNILFFYLTIGNNPPLPNELDTLIIQEVYASPGDTVGIPFYAITPEMLTGINLHFAFNDLQVEFLNIEYGQFFSTENYYEYEDGVISFQLASLDPVSPGHNPVGQIIMAVSPDVLPGTDIDLDLIGGWYYPSGFGNYSIPTYFIPPVLVDGIIHVVTTGMNEVEIPELPDIYLSNYPNPFNASTVIEFELLNDSPIKLIIYDLLGREIDHPISAPMSTGHHEITWDGSGHPSGIYFYRLETAEGSYTRRMTLLK